MSKPNATREYRTMRGLCPGCGLQPPEKGRYYCDVCRRRNRQRMRDTRTVRRLNGLCVVCGEPNAGEYDTCDACRAKCRIATRKSKAKRRERDVSAGAPA